MRRVEIALDGQTVLARPAFFRAAGISLHRPSMSSTINRTPIAPDESINVLSFQDPSDFLSFASLDPHRYRYRICYRSVLDECWSIVSNASPPTGPSPDAVCGSDPAAEFTE